jgi:cysteine-rich repeat protein
MKISRMIQRSILATAVLVLGLVFGAGKAHSYPATPGCDDTGCHFDIRNNNDHGNGSLRTAIEEGCRKAGNHLVEFSRLPDSETIALESQLSLPSDCQGTFEFAGMQSKEITIDGSSLPKADQPSGTQCSLYVASNNHKIHHLTFTGAPFGICVYGSNITISDNNIGVKRDGSVAGNANGLYINGNGNNVWYNNIAGNTANGIVIVGHQNLIQVNNIGVLSSNLDGDKGNGAAGVRLVGSASQNTIGGDINGLANIIRYNKDGGVVLAGDSSSTRNKISHNHIARNKGLGIDLAADGVSLPQANPSGPNNMISMPTEVQVVPLQVGSHPTRFLFRGKAPTNVSGNLWVEVYLVDSQDISDTHQQDANGKSHGEGETLLVSQQVVKDSKGQFGVMLATQGLTITGNNVSAILLDDQGNTSEFSATLELKDQPNPGFPSGTPVCGNGKKESPEECDDGNNTNGDGCSSTCKNEPIPPCGDGHLDAGEQCDDGNAVNGDGCNTACQLEHPELCGNGHLDAGEQCDDGANTNGDGCNSTCQLEHPELCGNGHLDPGEQCDDGANTNGDGCNSTCQLEHPELCGNGHLDPGEQCDDGANTNGDGCNSTCQLEHPELCGNGHLDPGEQCDDGANTNGDGCNSTCQLEHPELCGNHTVDPGEQCDDGNHTPGDGCGPTCQNEGPGVCGNGTVEGAEGCDDGNKTAGDGCSATCTIEPGWTCTGSPSVCHKTCGNGTVDPGEQCDGGSCCDATTCQFKPAGTVCDDGNATTSNDQCNSTGLCSGTPGTTGPLNPPSNLDANPTPGSGTTGDGSGGTSVTVTFTDNSNNESGFHIERADGPCNTAVNFTTVGTVPASPGVGGTVTFIDTTVQAGQTYCYRARAFNDDNVSEPSNSDTVTLPNPGVGPGGPLEMGIEGGGCAMTPVENANRLMSFLTLIGSVPMAVFRMRRRK